MWLYIHYEPVTAFGLRPSNTTSTGGKSLVCPTPYAIKMALLDRIIRHTDVATGREWFNTLRDLRVWLKPPQAVAVNRTFQKVQRGWETKTRAWTSTIAQREYCFHAGELVLALGEMADHSQMALLARWSSAINYFGWRGSFIQWVDALSSEAAPAAPEFINLSAPTRDLQWGGFLQRMDEMQPSATFDDVSVMNPKAKGGRMSYTVVLPYQLAHHGPNHTVYARETR